MTVKSRRRAASSIDIDGSPSTMKPLCPRPRSSIRGAEARRRCCRSCRRENSGRSARPSRTARAAPAGRGRECRRPPCRGLSESDRPKQPIAHPAADDERAAAALAHRARNFDHHRGSGSRFGHFEIIHGEIMSESNFRSSIDVRVLLAAGFAAHGQAPQPAGASGIWRTSNSSPRAARMPRRISRPTDDS